MKITKRMIQTILASLLLFFPALTRAETAVEAWVQRYIGPGNFSDEAQAVAVDGNDNVIVTGNSWGNGSGHDYSTLKYSSAGVPLWTNRYNGEENNYDFATAGAVDGSNNVIVTGRSWGSGSGYDYVTIQYSSAGVPLWTNRYNGSGNGYDFANAIAVDSSNNVIVTGHSADTTNADYATVKYSSAGVPLWTNRYNAPGNHVDDATAVAVDGNNNVIVTGNSWGSGSGHDYATIQYSSAGVPLWTNRYNGTGNDSDEARAVAVDGSNNVIVTGVSWSGSGYDYVTIQYSSAGVPLWTNRYNGPVNGGTDGANAVAVDGNNNVIVTGSSYDSGMRPDYATVKYSSTGAPLWTNCYNGTGNDWDEARAVAVDDGNNVIVTGYSSAGSGSGNDYATVKYSSAGVPLWTNRYNGPANRHDLPRTRSCLAIGLDGAVVVTGVSDAVDYILIANGNFATVKYILVSPPLITDQPASRTNNAGTTATFSVVAIGTEPLSYQWMKDGTNSLTDGGRASGATTATLTLSNITTNEAGSYSVVVTNAAGAVTSSNAVLTVIPVLHFDTSPAGLHWTTNGFLLTLADLLGQGSATIYVSTNLVDWEVLMTNPPMTGTLQFIDTEATNRDKRFYRASEQW